MCRNDDYVKRRKTDEKYALGIEVTEFLFLDVYLIVFDLPSMYQSALLITSISL